MPRQRKEFPQSIFLSLYSPGPRLQSTWGRVSQPLHHTQKSWSIPKRVPPLTVAEGLSLGDPHWVNLSSNRCPTSCPNLRVFFAPIQGWILWSAFYSCATSWPEHEPCCGLPPTKSLPLLYTLLLSAPRSHSSACLSSSLSCGLFCRCSLKTGMPRLSCWILHA